MYERHIVSDDVNRKGLIRLGKTGDVTTPTSGQTDVVLFDSKIHMVEGRRCAGFKAIKFGLYTSHVSASNGVKVYASWDGGTDYRLIETRTAAAGENRWEFSIWATDIRVTYDNSANTLTAFEWELFGDPTSLAASEVSISSIDAVTPGTGATNLGKAEDAVHASGDVGVAALAVRRDTASSGAANGDYATLSVDSAGALRTSLVGRTVLALTDATAPVGSNTVVIYRSTDAGRGLDALNAQRISFAAKHSHPFTLKQYVSSNAGVTWDQYGGDLAVPVPGATDISGPFDFPTDGFIDWKLELENGGTDQDPWRPHLIAHPDRVKAT